KTTLQRNPAALLKFSLATPYGRLPGRSSGISSAARCRLTAHCHVRYARSQQMINERCDALRRDGNPCRAERPAGSRFCFSHDPTRAAEREAAETASLLQSREAQARREARRRVPRGTCCPRCASFDVNPEGKGMPESWTCRVCGHRF